MTKKERKFIDIVLAFYETNGRRQLPWRHTTNPYLILVSELMLQQTQVERVIPKFNSFTRRWPTVHDLARAPLAAVLKEWQGLGYNRRAKFLWDKGIFPTVYTELTALPGIGPYTAGAIMAFAYDEPIPVIETNLRTVFIHHFFTERASVSDTELMKYIARTLPRENVRTWYAALMDYGSHLKKVAGNKNTQSQHYKKQPSFKGSNREIRGALLRVLATFSNQSRSEVAYALKNFPPERVTRQIDALIADGLIIEQRKKLQLPG
jgi:A/G-specific adenine glycosylase